MNTMNFKTYNRWNYITHEYDAILIPAKFNLKTYSKDEFEIVNCAQCTKKLPVYESYVSLEVHDEVGFGYMVCSECYDEEWKRRRKYRDDC